MTKRSLIGDLLIRGGLIDATGLERAQELQARAGGSLGRAIADLGLASEDAVFAAMAKELHLEYLGAQAPDVSPEMATTLPADSCHKRLIVPLGLQGSSLRLAMADPVDYSTISDVEFRTGRRVVVVVTSESSIRAMLNQLYPSAPESEKIYNLLASVNPAGEMEAAQSEYEVIDPASLAKDTELPPIVRLVNLMLSDAAKQGASDIHVEPQENILQVRCRLDGQLHDVLKVPKELQDATISRLKIISGMDIAERRKPQDGRSRLRFEGKRIDLRVSTLPTQFGEKVVIRLLDSSKAQLPIVGLGLRPENLRLLKSLLSRPQGMILVTGPTGSGKTSTLYTSLNWVKSPTNNIITVEDPIEYQLPGVNQVQINTKGGVTFAAGLRSILRQDPNIILVGEIRDRETANIALEAAQTGHLLLSTLHTNDAPATITRLLDLGIEPFMVASSVIGILAQRLVARICPSCKSPQPPSPEAVERAGGSARLPTAAQWMAGRGCDACRQTGLKGRLAVHELLEVTEEIRELISRRAPEHELRKAARIAGMQTLMEDAIAKAAQGLTTLEEVVRVVTQDDASAVKEQPRVAVEDVPKPAAIKSTPAERPEGKQRVLIVEDSPTILSVVKYFLELEGFEVLVAEDGLVGLEVAKRERPHVIVSDINMPGMDGMSMVKALRSDPVSQDMAILMLTSESSVESETQGLAVGADDYILKPVEPRRLVARIKALLARLQARTESSLAGQ